MRVLAATRCGCLARALLPVLTAVAACSGSPPIPDRIQVGEVTVETDPLALVIDTKDGPLRIANFVAIGLVDRVDDTRYYDPADPPAAVDWHAPTKATGFDADNYTLTLDDGVELSLGEGASGQAVLDIEAPASAVLVRLALPREPGALSHAGVPGTSGQAQPAEAIFGFGENYRSAVAGGDVREMQLRIDFGSESGTNETHAPVPLALWPARGLGLFIEDPRPGAFDIGKSDETLVTATFALVGGAPLRAHVLTADEPLDLVRTYARLTALPAVPPLWAFAPQQWRNAHNSSAEVIDDATAMRALGIPTGVMWIDNPWQTQYNSFEFDEGRFAEIDSVLAQVQDLGYRVLVWSTPYVNTALESDYAEARERGFLVTDDVGVPFVFPWQDGPGSLVDFTADGAIGWWRERIRRATDLGISGFKLDFGEDLVPELGGNLTPFTLAAGTSQSLHKHYSSYYHEAYLGALPAGDGFIITRSGAYGGQKVNTCIWPGDLDSNFSRHGAMNDDGTTNVGGLPAAIAAGLSLSVSGYPFYGSDIGGFREGPPTTETLLRWAEVASLGTIMQLGGGGSSHNPWDDSLFDSELAVPIYRAYAQLHMRLVPYLYSLAVIAGADGTPVVRPTRFVYPGAASDDATFLVGDDLFVAPVIEAGATTRAVVLPPGEWIDWWTGELYQGDGSTTFEVAAPLETLPLWRRRGALIPLFARDADTLTKAVASEVTSYADPAVGRELRILSTPASGEWSSAPWDGSTASIVASETEIALSAQAGARFDIVTFDLDGRADGWSGPASVTANGAALPVAGDLGQLESCPAPGCYLWEAEAHRLQVRLWTSGSVTSALVTR